MEKGKRNKRYERIEEKQLMTKEERVDGAKGGRGIIDERRRIGIYDKEKGGTRSKEYEKNKKKVEGYRERRKREKL